MLHFSQDPTELAFVQNPYTFYERARTENGLFYWEDYGRICATSHSAVNTFLRERRWGREVLPEFATPYGPAAAPFTALEKHSMLELDPPVHTRLRGQVVRAFTSRKIAAFGPQSKEYATQLIEHFKTDAPDLIPQFCAKIPVTMIARLLGVPETFGDQLLAWSHDMVAMYPINRTFETEVKAATASTEFSEFISDIIDLRKADPKDDLISTLISAHSDTETISRAELISTCILILNAGHEATVHAMGNTIKLLMELKEDAGKLLMPEMVSQTIEESLRFDPPLHLFVRHAKEDVDMFGHSFKRGDTVALLLAAANRDPSAFERPDEFIVNRTNNSQLSFGAGLHFCIGAPLARIEMINALPILFQCFPHMSFAEPPVYADKYHFHGLEHLKVSLNI